eukprot:EG_transcript_32154
MSQALSSIPNLPLRLQVGRLHSDQPTVGYPPSIPIVAPAPPFPSPGWPPPSAPVISNLVGGGRPDPVTLALLVHLQYVQQERQRLAVDAASTATASANGRLLSPFLSLLRPQPAGQGAGPTGDRAAGPPSSALRPFSGLPAASQSKMHNGVAKLAAHRPSARDLGVSPVVLKEGTNWVISNASVTVRSPVQ